MGPLDWRHKDGSEVSYLRMVAVDLAAIACLIASLSGYVSPLVLVRRERRSRRIGIIGVGWGRRAGVVGVVGECSMGGARALDEPATTIRDAAGSLVSWPHRPKQLTPRRR